MHIYPPADIYINEELGLSFRVIPLSVNVFLQKENDFDMTLMDVVKSLRSALSKFL